MSRTPTFLLILSLLLVAAGPLADAHAAPDPRDFETRALHDHNDDAAVVLAGQHGFDSIALDVREGRLPDSGDPALILRLILNGGCDETAPGDCGTLTQTVRFQADGTDHEVTFESPDGGASFTGSADHYVQPTSINDGTRFAVEGWVAFAALDIGAGATLSDFFVDATDAMPQGAVPGAPDPTGAAYDIGEYTLAEPVQYVTLATDTTALDLHPDERDGVDLLLQNTITLEQEVALKVTADEGITASFLLEDAAAGETNLSLAPDATQSLPLQVTAGAGTDGFVTVTATSILGAYETVRIPVKVEAAMDESFLQSPDLLPGESWSHTFRTVGVFSYHNHHSPASQGTITIEGDHDPMGEGMQGMQDDPTEAQTHTVAFDGAAFDPQETAVRVGDTVVFQNDGDGSLMIMGGVSDDGHMDHGDHDHGDEASDDFLGIPALPVPLLLAALAAVVLVLRRRG